MDSIISLLNIIYQSAPVVIYFRTVMSFATKNMKYIACQIWAAGIGGPAIFTNQNRQSGTSNLIV